MLFPLDPPPLYKLWSSKEPVEWTKYPGNIKAFIVQSPSRLFLSNNEDISLLPPKHPNPSALSIQILDGYISLLQNYTKNVRSLSVSFFDMKKDPVQHAAKTMTIHPRDRMIANYLGKLAAHTQITVLGQNSTDTAFDKNIKTVMESCTAACDTVVRHYNTSLIS